MNFGSVIRWLVDTFKQTPIRKVRVTSTPVSPPNASDLVYPVPDPIAVVQPEEFDIVVNPVEPVVSPWLPESSNDRNTWELMQQCQFPANGVDSENQFHQAVVRFQLQFGLTVDGDPGPKTRKFMRESVDRISELRQVYWSGDVTEPHSMHGNKTWVMTDGIILSDDNVSPNQSEVNMAKLMQVNFKKELDGIEPEWRRMFGAVILTESSGRRNVQPRFEPHIDDYSFGPGQVLFRTAQGLGYEGEPDGLNDPGTNSIYVMKLLKRIRAKKLHGIVDPVLEVACYNAGGVYASGRNSWGIRHYGSHLTRFVRNWNAIALSGVKE